MTQQSDMIQIPICILDRYWPDEVLGRVLRLVAHMREKADEDGSCELALHDAFRISRKARTDLALEALRVLPEVTDFQHFKVEVDTLARTARVIWPSYSDWK